MAKKRRSKKQETQLRSLLLSAVAVVICIAASLFLGQDRLNEILDVLFTQSGLSSAPAQVEGDLKVHFIDVGQGDCTLIQTETQNVLVDAGERGNGDTIIAYLRAQKVRELDLVVATHPHSDHIGSMPEVLEEFPARELLFGNVPEKLTPTSRIYEKLLDEIDSKSIPVTEAAPGLQYDLGGGAQITVLGPVSDDADDLNNTSVVFRLDYGSTAFLFTGDAEKASEREILASPLRTRLRADVLKLGHHGSSTSTTREWLDAVRPKIAVALLGADNEYGHPHKETLEKLAASNITLYRSDLQGTIVIGSDGETLSVSAEKAA